MNKKILIRIVILLLLSTRLLATDVKKNKNALDIYINKDGGIFANSDGESLELKEKYYQIGKELNFIYLHTNKTEEERGCFFSFEVIMEKVKVTSIPVYEGQQIGFKDARDTELIELGKVILTKSETIYNVVITRFNSLEEKLKKKNGAIIFKRGFETYRRYYLGMNIGFLFTTPFKSTESYKLEFESPTAEKRTILADNIYEPRMLIFCSIYPWGFEPERPLSENLIKRVHINFGTELSKSIFKKLYMGAGCNLSNYFSLDLFVILGKEGTLSNGFSVGTEVQSALKTVPLDYKTKWSFGVAFSLPFDIVAKSLGKVFGM